MCQRLMTYFLSGVLCFLQKHFLFCWLIHTGVTEPLKVSPVTCHLSPVTCHISPVKNPLLQITCHLSFGHWPPLYSASPAIKVPGGLVLQLQAVYCIKKMEKKCIIVSSQKSCLRNMIFDQMCPFHFSKKVTKKGQTKTQGHSNV